MKKLQGTIVFVVKDGKVLLARKKLVLGIGKWNGYGGKLDIEIDKDFLHCAVREFGEESGGATIKRGDLEQVALVTFHNGDKFEFTCYIYIASDLKGFPTETDEMGEPTWFPIDRIPPKEDFMESDYFWIPRVLSGEKLLGDIWYDGEFHLTKRGVELQTVDHF